MNHGEKRCAVYEAVKDLGKCTFGQIVVRVPNIPEMQVLEILEFLEKKRNIVVKCEKQDQSMTMFYEAI